MEMEKQFYPDQKKKEASPKSHSVSFGGRRFGDSERIVDTEGVVHELNKWWDKICIVNELDPRVEELEEFGYHIIELGKNIIEYADGGGVEVIFKPQEITAIASDAGQGFEDLDEINYYLSIEHGLAQVKQYADRFMIETKGRKFAKVVGEEDLADIGESEVVQGLRVTLTKNFSDLIN